MGRIVISVVLGLLSPFVFIMGAAPFEVHGSNSVKEVLAGCIAVALYLAVCQFLVARSSEIVDRAVPPSTPSSTLWEKVRGKAGDFKSIARIKVERDQSDIAGLADAQKVTGYNPYFVQTEFETIQSEAILGKVIKDLNLNEAWGKKQGGRTLDRKVG